MKVFSHCPSKKMWQFSDTRTTLVDQYGYHVADVDGSGLDHNTGKRYEKGADGSWSDI